MITQPHINLALFEDGRWEICDLWLSLLANTQYFQHTSISQTDIHLHEVHAYVHAGG